MYIKNGQFRKHKYIISYVPPDIYLQPIGGTKKSGQSFTFKIKARGSAPLTYQWYVNNFPIFGATSNVLTIPFLQPSDDGLYYCRVENHKYPIDSNTVKLNVFSTIGITQQPLSAISNPNNKVTFSVTVTGDEPIQYQWYKNKNPIAYSSKTSYIIPHVSINDEGIYFCKISNQFDVLTSNSVALSVNKPLQVITIPPNAKLNPNTNYYSDYLNVTGTKPITAYWRKNKVKFGSDIINNSGYIPLTINNLTDLNTGSYDCVLTNIVGTITSNSFNIYVNQRVDFTTQPLSANVLVNNPVTFTVSTSGTTPINYQWYSSDGLISGETFSSYTINRVDFTSQKKYWCVASNIVNSVTSTMVQLSADIKSIVNDSQEYIVFDGGEYWVY
jgi:hypothetical protein